MKKSVNVTKKMIGDEDADTYVCSYVPDEILKLFLVTCRDLWKIACGTTLWKRKIAMLPQGDRCDGGHERKDRKCYRNVVDMGVFNWVIHYGSPDAVLWAMVEKGGYNTTEYVNIVVGRGILGMFYDPLLLPQLTHDVILKATEMGNLDFVKWSTQFPVFSSLTYARVANTAYYHGRLNILRWLRETYDVLHCPKEVGCGVVRKCAPVVKWLEGEGLTLPANPHIHPALVNDDVDLLEWCVKRGENVVSEANIGVAVEHGSLQVTKWLIQSGAKPSRRSIGQAAFNGHVEILKELEVHSLFLREGIVKYVDNLEVAKWMFHTFGERPSVEEVLMKKKWDVVLWLGDTGEKIKTSDISISDFETVRWVYRRYPYYRTTEAIDQIVGLGDDELLRLLVNIGIYPSQEVVDNVARMGNNSQLEILINFGVHPSQCCLDELVVAGKVDIVSMLIGKGMSPSGSVVDIVVLADDVEMTKILLSSGQYPSKDVIKQLARRPKISNVLYLLGKDTVEQGVYYLSRQWYAITPLIYSYVRSGIDPVKVERAMIVDLGQVSSSKHVSLLCKYAKKGYTIVVVGEGERGYEIRAAERLLSSVGMGMVVLVAVNPATVRDALAWVFPNLVCEASRYYGLGNMGDKIRKYDGEKIFN